MTEQKPGQDVPDNVITKCEKAMEKEGYQIKLPINSLDQKLNIPVIYYGRRRYCLGLSNELDKWPDQMCVAFAVIKSGLDILREYDTLSSKDELFNTFPIVKTYYLQILQDMGL